MHSIMQSKSYVDNSQRLFKGQLVKPNSKALFLLIYRNPEMISRSKCGIGKCKIFICVFNFYRNNNWMIFILFSWSFYQILNVINIYWLVVIFWNIYIWSYILKKKKTFLFKIKSCLTNVCLLKFKLFTQKRGSVEFGKVLYQ